MKWITREHPRVDRVACPWLIEKFVDRQAEFIYVPTDRVAAEAQRRGATPYDTKDAGRFVVHDVDIGIDSGMVLSLTMACNELCTNAIKYGRRRDDVRVRFAVDVADSHVRVEVGDRGRGFVAGHVVMPGPEGESGRGLAFLDALASRWGVVRNGESCVWFELDL